MSTSLLCNNFAVSLVPTKPNTTVRRPTEEEEAHNNDGNRRRQRRQLPAVDEELQLEDETEASEEGRENSRRRSSRNGPTESKSTTPWTSPPSSAALAVTGVLSSSSPANVVVVPDYHLEEEQQRREQQEHELQTLRQRLDETGVCVHHTSPARTTAGVPPPTSCTRSMAGRPITPFQIVSYNVWFGPHDPGDAASASPTTDDSSGGSDCGSTTVIATRSVCLFLLHTADVVYGISRNNLGVAIVLRTGLIGPTGDYDWNDVFPAAISAVLHYDDESWDIVCSHGPRDLTQNKKGDETNVINKTSLLGTTCAVEWEFIAREDDYYEKK